jgi:hypothetical protein
MKTLSVKQLYWLLLLPMIAAFVAIAQVDSVLQTAHAPFGIVSLQLCAFTDSCSTILNEWGAVQREAAMLSLGLDYLVMFLYGATLWAALMWYAEALTVSSRKLVTVLAYFAPMAALLDVAENALFIWFLQSPSSAYLALVGGVLALIKFMLLAVVLPVWFFLSVKRVINIKL